MHMGLLGTNRRELAGNDSILVGNDLIGEEGLQLRCLPKQLLPVAPLCSVRTPYGPSGPGDAEDTILSRCPSTSL